MSLLDELRQIEKTVPLKEKKQETVPKNVPYDELRLVGDYVYDALSDKLKKKIEARDFDDTDIVNWRHRYFIRWVFKVLVQPTGDRLQHHIEYSVFERCVKGSTLPDNHFFWARVDGDIGCLRSDHVGQLFSYVVKRFKENGISAKYEHADSTFRDVYHIFVYVYCDNKGRIK